MAQRGWAIAALADISGQDVDEGLLGIHSDAKQSMLVRTWAAAARVKMTFPVSRDLERLALHCRVGQLGLSVFVRVC